MTIFNKNEFFGNYLNELILVTAEELKNEYILKEYKRLKRYNKKINSDNSDLIILPMNFSNQNLINFINKLIFQGYYKCFDNGGLGKFYLPTKKYYDLINKLYNNINKKTLINKAKKLLAKYKKTNNSELAKMFDVNIHTIAIMSNCSYGQVITNYFIGR